MKILNQPKDAPAESEAETDSESLLALVRGRTVPSVGPAAVGSGVVVGELIGITDDGHTPFVTFRGQVGTAAIAARSVVDLHGAHIGRQVVLVFEDADLARPIVMGVLHDAGHSALGPRPGTVEVDRDGERMIIGAREQLVLQCGKAKLTLTRAGKVLIEGTYISSRSSGVNRLKGGSIQIN
jgi:hypothetical protein